MEEMVSQKLLVESFMKETFNDFETGENISAYHPFNGPVNFTQRLRTHLQAILDEIAGDMDEVIWDVATQGPPFLGLPHWIIDGLIWRSLKKLIYLHLGKMLLPN